MDPDPKSESDEQALEILAAGYTNAQQIFKLHHEIVCYQDEDAADKINELVGGMNAVELESVVLSLTGMLHQSFVKMAEDSGVPLDMAVDIMAVERGQEEFEEEYKRSLGNSD